jgi:hypothetical protein
MTNPFSDLDSASGLPDGTLKSVWQEETGCGTNLSISSAGCKGHFQFAEGTRNDILRKYGVDAFSHDPHVAAKAAGLYLKELKDKYNGDLPKALAAYNWGAGNVDKAVAKYGDKWLAHAPQETRKYVPEILGRIGKDFKIPDVGDMSQPGDDDPALSQRRSMLQGLGMSEEEARHMKPADILSNFFVQLIHLLLDKALLNNQGNDAGSLLPQIHSPGENVTPSPTPPRVQTGQPVPPVPGH